MGRGALTTCTGSTSAVPRGHNHIHTHPGPYSLVLAQTASHLSYRKRFPNISSPWTSTGPHSRASLTVIKPSSVPSLVRCER